MPTQPSKQLEIFDNPHPERDYLIRIVMPEFTCLCPKTGQPDFAILYLDYIADGKCVELKSLKNYIWSYRNEGAFHEAVTNKILNDLVAATEPRYMQLRAEFNVRGGIYTTVIAEHRKPGWNGQLPLSTATGEATPGAVQRPKDGPMQSATLKGRESATGGQATFLPANAEAPVPAAAETMVASGIYLGIDLGTSSCRVAAMTEAGEHLGQVGAPLPIPLVNDNQITQDPNAWWKAVGACVQRLLKEIDPQRVRAITVAGTSGTVLLCDKKGAPVTPAMMYHDSRAFAQAEKIAGIADAHSGAHGATSSLAKLMWLQEKQLDKKGAYFLHQADWIIGKLSGLWGVSDYNNCLKLGYDAEKLAWPSWFAQCGVDPGLLPKVFAPGEALGPISPEVAKAFGLPAETLIVAGTTDGVASFLAAGGSAPGHGVTALGSTLVLKLASDKPVFSTEHGVYSHRLGRFWLAGGASNSGGAVLLQYFKLEQMREMTPLLDPESFTGLDYYPLPGTGERFPINDPQMVPRLEPLPGNSVTFFQAMLEGIARIEAQGYQLLAKLGAPVLTELRTTGGGSQNPAWQRLRERTLGLEIKKARSSLAAHGAARLAAGLLE